MLTTFVLQFLIYQIASAEVDCIVNDDNYCVATCELNGVTVTLDISHIVEYPYQIDSDDKDISKFIFTPCTKSSCGKAKDSSICMTDKNNDDTNCGDVDKGSWELINTEPPYSFTIQYTGGTCKGTQCQSAKFTFEASETAHSTKIKYIKHYNEGSGEIYQFDVVGSCVGQPNCTPSSKGSSAGVIGIVLMLLFLVAIVAYFVIGSSIMYFHKGARGKEIIPNYELWLDLPFLLKDGCIFFISPCYNRYNHSASYEKM